MNKFLKTINYYDWADIKKHLYNITKRNIEDWDGKFIKFGDNSIEYKNYYSNVLLRNHDINNGQIFQFFFPR